MISKLGECECANYGIQFLVHHLHQARKGDKLSRLLGNSKWVSAKTEYDASRRSLAEDVELAIDFFEGGGVDGLIDYIVFSLMSSLLGTLAMNLPVESFALMVALGDGTRAENLASFLTDPAYRSAAYARICEIYVQSGDSLNARKAAQEAEVAVLNMIDSEARDRALIPIALSYAQLQEWDKSFSLVDMIQNETFKEHTLSNIGIIMSQVGMYKDGIDLIETISTAPFRVNAFARIANFADNQNETQVASDVRSCLRETIPHLFSENHAIEHLASAMGALFLADEFDSGFHLAKTTLDFHWTVRGIRWLAINGFPEKAVGLLEKFVAEVGENEYRTAEPTDIAKIYSSSGDFSNAVLAITQHPERRGIDGAWAAILWDMAEYEKYSLAKETLERIEDRSIRLWALAGLGQSYVTDGNLVSARDVLDCIYEESNQFRVRLDLKRFNELFRLYASLLHGDDVSVLSGGLEDLDDLLFATYSEFAEIGAFEYAEQALRKIQDPKAREDAEVKFIGQLVSKGRLDYAQKCMEWINPNIKDASYLILARGLISRNRWKEAMDLIQNASNSNIRDEYWREVAVTKIKSGEYDEAFEIMSTIRSWRIRDQAKYQIAVHLARFGSVQQALQLADGIKKKNLRLHAYTSIAPFILDNKDYSESQELLELCQGTRFEHQVTISLLLKMVAIGDFQKVIDYLRTVDKTVRERVSIGITRNLILNKQFHELRVIDQLFLDEGIEIQNGIKIHTYLEIDHIDDAMKLISSLDNQRVRHTYYRRSIEKHIEEERYDQAIELFRNEINPTGHNDALELIATGMARAGRLQDAQGVMERIQGIDHRFSAWQAIALHSLIKYRYDDEKKNEIIHRSLHLARSRGSTDVILCLEAMTPLLPTLISRADARILTDRLYEVYKLFDLE